MRIICALILGVFGSACIGVSANVDISKLPPASDKPGLTFARDIRPIFEASCLKCHGEQKPKEGLRLDILEGVIKGSKHGNVVIPGKSKESPLVIAVARLDEENAMPPKAKPGKKPAADAKNQPPPKPLTPEQVGLVRAWIDQGVK